MDEDVIFENSALYEHLQEAGYSCEDIAPETLASVVDSVKQSLQKDEQPDRENCSFNKSDMPRKKYKFSLKNFLFGIVKWLLGVNAWRSEAKDMQQQFAYELCEDVLNTRVVDNEDFEFIDKFTGSIKDQGLDANEDNLGEYFKHGAMFVLVLGYGIVRVVQIKQTGIGNIKTWSIDVLAVCLMVCVLLPSVIKIIGIERLKQRLRREKQLILKHLTELEKLHSLFKKSVRLVQETEVISRGFTLATGKPSSSHITNKERHCPALRKCVFKSARNNMLEAKNSAKRIMEVCPLQDLLEGGPNYLCLLPLDEYGPCVTVATDSPELESVTDYYALPAIKGMVSLWQSHVSEWLRIMCVYCLLSSHKPPTDFCTLFPRISNLQSNLSTAILHMEHSYLLHKCHLESSEDIEKRRQKDKDKTSSYIKSVNVAVNSLILHIKAAFNRLQKVEEKLNCVPDDGNTDDLSTDLENEITSDLRVIKCDLDACQECWTESMNRVNKSQKKSHTDYNPSRTTSDQATTDTTQNGADPKLIPLFDMADPIIEDQVFEAYTDHTETCCTEDYDDLNEAEQDKKKLEAAEAARVLRELKSVITVRAEETRQREIKAINRMKTESNKSETETKRNETRNLQNETSGESTVEMSSHCEEQSNSLSESTINNKQSKNTSTIESNANETEIETRLPSCDSSCLSDKSSIQTTSLIKESPKEQNNKLSQSANEQHQTELHITTEQTSSPESDDTGLSLKEKLEKLHGASFPFTTNIANLAVAKSHQMNALSEDTFGDEDSDSS